MVSTDDTPVEVSVGRLSTVVVEEDDEEEDEDVDWQALSLPVLCTVGVGLDAGFVVVAVLGTVAFDGNDVGEDGASASACWVITVAYLVGLRSLFFFLFFLDDFRFFLDASFSDDFFFRWNIFLRLGIVLVLIKMWIWGEGLRLS